MVKGTILCLVQLGLLYGTDQPHAQLPQYVFKADFCPNTNDSSQWKDASHRLHCLHDLDSTDAGNVYHCLPTSFLNETVEFCGEARTVPPGHCPIYNYTEKSGDVPGLYNCSAFISGCPSESFSSKDVRKFPACLNINRTHGGFKDDRNYQKTSVTPKLKETTTSEETATNSILPSIPTDSSPTPDDHHKAIYVPVIVIETCLIIILIIISLKDRCLSLQKKERKTLPTRIDERHPNEMENIGAVSTVNSSNEVIKESTPFMVENPTENVLDHEFNAKLNTPRVLSVLSELFTFEFNIPFLEHIFEECNKDDLVQICKTFTAKNNLEFEEIQPNFKQCSGSKHVKFMMRNTGKESITDQINNLRNWIVKTFQVHPGCILFTTVDERAFTFMMNEKHVNTLLDYVKTDDGQICLSRKGVEQIIQDKNVFEIAEAANGSHFLHVSVHSKQIPQNDDIKNLTLSTLQKTGLVMEGNKVYTRSAPSMHNENEDGSSSGRTFFKQHRDILLENLEPMNFCKPEIASLFDNDDMIKLNKTEGRRKKAERLLEMCDKLPKDKVEIIRSYFVQYISPPKTVTCNEEIASFRDWVEKNEHTLLDEMDSDFIKTAISHMKDVSEEDKILWLESSNKGREEKAKMFLKFALQKDVLALQRTIGEKDLNLNE